MKPLLRRASLLAALVCAGTAGMLPARADEADHERARQALEAGEIMPLRVILERVERDYPGRVMEVELEREDGRWLYEIRLVQRGGRMLKLEVDGADAKVLSVKGRGSGEARREGRAR